MAEVKNTFIKSKMNKDLDDRLIPNGEYRNAVNINVSKSEGPDVGAMENVLGNISIEDFGLALDENISIIGKFMDLSNDFIFVFMTDYTDSSPDKLSNFAPSSANHYIWKYDLRSDQPTLIIGPQGNLTSGQSFLNFSKTHPIDNINLIEDLLFWTDNRNQPRKINIERELGYYTNEDQISVAKYYPYQPIQLFDEVITGITIINSGTGYQTCSNNPNSCGVPMLATFGAPGSGLTVNITGVSNPSGNFPPTGGVTNIEINTPGNGYVDGQQLFLNTKQNGNGCLVEVSTELKCTMTNKSEQYFAAPETVENENPNYDPEWQGDIDFLQDKFVRFSYRFLYEDGEYSLIAPFTQPCFIPKQYGYFNSVPSSDPNITWEVNDQQEAYESTIVKFMENLVQEVTFVIPSPGVNPFENLRIKAIEILYKDSNQDSIRVVDTIKGRSLEDNVFANAFYTYKSEKPYKALPAREITRVYDKVPVRALTQEVSGNRVIYGNYEDRQSYPKNIEYRVGFSDKWQPTNIISNRPFATNASIEYPNHSVKQNRSYQVGIVLSDRYGRQSPVILSSSDIPFNPTTGFGGDTIYVPYRNDLNVVGPNYDEAVWKWPGYSLKVLFNNVIPMGEVGAWATDNPLGWYSYKIVVKQQEQDYYNVYLPGLLNGYPGRRFGGGNDQNNIAFTPLINDNINKIPRRLNEVGPNEKLYGSGVLLYGRVTNWWSPDISSPTSYPGINYTRQFNIAPGKYDVAVTIGPKSDLSLNDIIIDALMPPYVEVPGTSGDGEFPFYNGSNNPLFASIEPSFELINPNTVPTPPDNTIGVVGYPFIQTQNNDNWTSFSPQLAVYETDPTKSKIDIYWETTSAGLISELNDEIRTGDPTLPFEVEDWNFFLPEDQSLLPTGLYVTDNFYFKNQLGNQINDIVGVDNLLVTDISFPTPTVLNNQFTLEYSGGNTARIKLNPNIGLVYLENVNERIYEFTFDVTTSSGVVTTLTVEGNLLNIPPKFTNFASNINPTSPQNLSFKEDFIGPWVIEATNGTSVAARDKEELKYEIVKQEQVNGNSINNFILTTSNNGNITTAELSVDPNNLLLTGDYFIEIKVTDANGVGLSSFLTINAFVTAQSVTPGFFGPTNNYYNFSFSNDIDDNDVPDTEPVLNGAVINLGNKFSIGYWDTLPPDVFPQNPLTVTGGQQSQALGIPWFGMGWAMTKSDSGSIYNSKEWNWVNGDAMELEGGLLFDHKRNKWIYPYYGDQLGTVELGYAKADVWTDNNNTYRTKFWKVGRYSEHPYPLAAFGVDLSEGTVNVCVEFELKVRDWRRTLDDVGEIMPEWLLFLTGVVSLFTKYKQAPELYWILRSAVDIQTRSLNPSSGNYSAWSSASDINARPCREIFNGNYQSAPIDANSLGEAFDKSYSQSVKATETSEADSNVQLFFNAPSPPDLSNSSGIFTNQDVSGGTVKASFNFAFDNPGQYKIFVANMGSFNSYSPNGQLNAGLGTEASNLAAGGAGEINGQPWNFRGSTRSDNPIYGIPGRWKSLRGGSSTFKKNGCTVIARENGSNTQNINAIEKAQCNIYVEDINYRNGNSFVFYPLLLCTDYYSTRQDAEGNALANTSGGDPQGVNGIEVFAKYGPLRYVDSFYERTGTPGNYSYSKWVPPSIPINEEVYVAYGTNPSPPADCNPVLTRDHEYSCTFDFSVPDDNTKSRVWTCKINAFGDVSLNEPKTLYYSKQ